MGFRSARQLRRGLRFCVRLLQSLVPGTPGRPDAKDAEEPQDLPTVENLPSVPRVPQDAKPCRLLPTAPDEIAYHPACWSLPEEQNSKAVSLDLLILSPVHRTGSTLLQRICNARKGTLIWGEHGGVLTQFASIYTNAAFFSLRGESERKEFFGQDENPNLWIANMCPELECVQQAIVDSARTLMSSLYGRYRKSHDILGFKEVHYGPAELELLRHCYPRAQLLLLSRNPLNAWRSTTKEWYRSLDDWIERYNNGVRGYCEFAKRDANCHLIRYVDLIERENRTMELLGDVAKVSREQISMVLTRKIGASGALLTIRTATPF